MNVSTGSPVATGRIEFPDEHRHSDSMFQRFKEGDPTSKGEQVLFGTLTGAGVGTGFAAMGAFMVGSFNAGGVGGLLVPTLAMVGIGAGIGAAISAASDLD